MVQTLSGVAEMKISFHCRDGVTTVADLTLRRIRSEYIDAVLETYHPSQVLSVASFDSPVVRSILTYIENGKLMFDRHCLISPEYLQTIYRACDYFQLGEYPELIDDSLLEVCRLPVLARSTLYGRIGTNSIDTKTFRDCFISKLHLDSAVTQVTFDSCLFRHCDFRRASFDETSTFQNCLFADCDLTEVRLPSIRNCQFRSCLLTQSTVDFGTVLNDTHFESCSMRHFQAKDPTMVYSRNLFKSCDLSGAVLVGFENCTEIRCVLSHTLVDNRATPRSSCFLPATSCVSLVRLEAPRPNIGDS